MYPKAQYSVVPQDVKADIALQINVRMVDLCSALDFRWLMRIVCIDLGQTLLVRGRGTGYNKLQILLVRVGVEQAML